MDVIGPIIPKASNGHCYIFVVVDYFTKWVEATSYVSVTRTVVCKFIKKEIIYWYVLPERIISDNRANFKNKMMKEVCDQFKIKHNFGTLSSKNERSSRGSKKIVKKMTETYKDWHENFPFVLFAYRTAMRTSTGATPYSLVYGMEVVLPIEVEIPSLRVLIEARLEEAKWIKMRYDS